MEILKRASMIVQPVSYVSEGRFSLSTIMQTQLTICAENDTTYRDDRFTLWACLHSHISCRY